MSAINFTMSLQIDEIAKAILTTGEEVTTIVQGEPGIGKSSILKLLAEMNGDEWRKPGDDFADDKYDYIYVDCPVKDMMDIGANIPNHETKTLEYYVASLFKLDSPKPKIIMLDEFMKAPKLLQVIFTRLMLEKMVGDKPTPAGSIIWGTSNQETDGVGDSMLSHAGNRVCKVTMAKPTPDNWLQWASKAGISRVTRTWVAMTPRCMAAYTDPNQESNEYIFQPSRKGQFVSPRSLAKGDVVIRNRDKLGEKIMMAQYAGICGEAAARSIAAFVSLESQLTPYEKVIESPTTVKVPDDVAAQVMMLLEGSDYVDNHDDLAKFMQFVNRIKNNEIQSIFFTLIMRNKPKLGRHNAEINEWARENFMLL
jgi:hypothetical protein